MLSAKLNVRNRASGKLAALGHLALTQSFRLAGGVDSAAKELVERIGVCRASHVSTVPALGEMCNKKKQRV